MNKLDSNLVPTFLDADAVRAKVFEIGEDPQLSDDDRRLQIVSFLRECLSQSHKAGQGFLMSAKPLSEARLGLRTAKGLSRAMDAVVCTVFAYTTELIYPRQNPTSSEQLAVVATGGYGRDTLAPYSDVDLLFLLPYKQTAWGEQVVETALYLLWDLGLKVGHATRSVEDCIVHAQKDVTIRTTLLESRFLIGDHQLFTRLRKRFWDDVGRASSMDFIEAKLAERESRHERTGGSRYAVEPNLKDGKGGLRDLHTLMWIGKFVYRVESTATLINHGLLTDDEFDLFERAEAFLWEVRCQLHFIAGRAEEKLSFDRQLDLTERFGFEDTEEMRGVERFMKRYFLVAKDVGDLTRYILAALETRHKKSFPSIGDFFGFRRNQLNLPDGFVVDGGRLNVASQETYTDNPVNLLRLFYLSDSEDILCHPNALKLAARCVDLITDELRNDKEANDLFLSILTSRADPERVLRRMNETGVLGAFIPDFGQVVAMMQFNMYHHYTVDEHLLRAVGNLARIERGELKEEHPLADSIIRKLQNRRVLYLAVFLHDIAKGRKGDHSELGAEIAFELGPRLGFSKSETETVAWLVEQHLVMSAMAQSRDPADPRTIEDFTHIVQSPERLKLLLILTVADIRAVGPGVWNGWKGELLRTLYQEAEPVLAGGHSTEPTEGRIEARQEQLMDALPDWSEQDKQRLVQRMPTAYWLGMPTAFQKVHAKFMRDADNAGETIATTFVADEFRSVTALSVYADDRAGLFALLAGVILSVGASIQDAKAFTTNDGKILDIFWLQDATGEPLQEKDRIGRLEDRLRAALNGEFNPLTAISNERLGRRQQAFTVEPDVIIDNQASELLTVIEINARDRRGLLYDVAKTISTERLRISSAHTATFGERVVGVFYVKDNFGLKLTHSARIDRLKESLIDAASFYDADVNA